MRNINPKFAIGGGVMALLIAGGTYASVAFAQQSPSGSASPSPSVSSPASASAASSASPSPNASAKPNGAAARQAFLQHLASHLNISVDQLQNALKAAAHDSVNDALAAGRITQQQASQANQRIDSGQFPFGVGFLGRPGGPHGVGPRKGGPHLLNAAAQALGETPQQLGQQLRGGQTLQQVAGSKWPAVQQAMINAVNADSNLTQQQKTNLINKINSGNFPRPFRGRGPRPSGGASPAPSASA
jgi:hypothetical protein